MSFASLNDDDGNEPLAEINMIPLIDVMLVLLVIFIVTAPLLGHAVKVDLPRASSQPNAATPVQVRLTLAADGSAYWEGQPVAASELEARLQQVAASDPQTELQLHADGAVAYRKVAEVMSAAARTGLTRIGFVTDPRSH